jgi:8-oxo-dGTP pyrophosphatase MutT (NUDIX family)
MPQEKKQWEREFSAGGVVYRMGEEGPEVALIMPNKRNQHAPTGKWGLPKGLIEYGEKPDRAGEREVFEETGLRAKVESDLGPEKYFYKRDGKNIMKLAQFYLMRYVSGEPKPDPLEVYEVRWFKIVDAISALAHKGEKEATARALQILMRELPSG